MIFFIIKYESPFTHTCIHLLLKLTPCDGFPSYCGWFHATCREQLIMPCASPTMKKICYIMCIYHQKTYYPHFLKSNPGNHSRGVIVSTNLTSISFASDR